MLVVINKIIIIVQLQLVVRLSSSSIHALSIDKTENGYFIISFSCRSAFGRYSSAAAINVNILKNIILIYIVHNRWLVSRRRATSTGRPRLVACLEPCPTSAPYPALPEQRTVTSISPLCFSVQMAAGVSSRASCGRFIFSSDGIFRLFFVDFFLFFVYFFSSWLSARRERPARPRSDRIRAEKSEAKRCTCGNVDSSRFRPRSGLPVTAGVLLRRLRFTRSHRFDVENTVLL